MKKILTLVIAIVFSAIVSVTASAAASVFTLRPTVDQTDNTVKVQKLDDLYAAVTVTHAMSNQVQEGTGTFNCTFRVRTENGAYATNYIDVICRYRTPSQYDSNGNPIDLPDDDMGNTQRMNYFSNMGIIGNKYKLYSSFDDNQYIVEGVKHEGCTVSGRWEP